jgi:hypothetical protein
MTQQEMLDAQWSEDSGLFGFTDSDWYKDAKDLLSFGFMLNNADKLGATNQQQAELMYTVPTNTQPNAQYVDPRYTNSSVQAGGIDSRYLLLGGAAVLAYLVFK